MTASLAFYDHATNSSIMAIGDDIPSIWNPYFLFNVRQYGVRGDGVTDDTAGIQACIAAAVAYGKPAEIYFPKGVYLVQDPDGLPHSASSDGPIRIPPGAQHIRLNGPSARILIGSNGVSTAAIRNFGRYTKITNLDIDCNAGVAINTKANVGIQNVGSLSPGVDGSDSIIANVTVRNSRDATTTYSTGTIVYDATGGAHEMLITLSGGSFPSWVTTGARISVAGNWYTVGTRWDATNISLSAGPGTDAGSAAYEAVGEFLNGQNHDGIQNLSGADNTTIENCRCFDMGWNGFRVSGNNIRLKNIWSTSQRGNGLRVNDSSSVFLDGFTCYSDYCSGRSLILVDPGSGADATPDDITDQRCQMFVAKNLDLYGNTDGRWEGACIAIKIGATVDTVIRDSRVRVGKLTNNVSFRVEDCCNRCTVEDCEFTGQWSFTSGIFQGAPTTFASNGAGSPKLNITLPSGHGLVAGKSFWVHGGNSAQDNQEHVVNSVATNVITTNTPYISSAVGSNIYAHSILEELVVKRVKVTRLNADGQNVFMDNIYAYNINMEDITFFQEGYWSIAETTKQIGIKFNFGSDKGCNRLRVVRFKFNFNSSALCKGFGVSDQDQLKTSGKIISYGHDIQNRRGGTTVLADTYNNGDSNAAYAANRAALFRTQGEDPNTVLAASVPTGTDVTFAAGTRCLFDAPASGAAPGAVCTTGGAVGTWKNMAVLA